MVLHMDDAEHGEENSDDLEPSAPLKWHLHMVPRKERRRCHKMATLCMVYTQVFRAPLLEAVMMESF